MGDDERIAANVAKMRAQKATDAEIEHYLSVIEGRKPTAPPVTVPEVPQEPSVRQRQLGGIASFGRSIPGVPALQAGARALVRGEGAKDFAKGAMGGNGDINSRIAAGLASLVGSPSYANARDEINEAEESAPAAVRGLNSLTGGTVAALATPGNALKVAGKTILSQPVVQGATYGVASAVGDSDPEKGLGDRAQDAAISGTIGGLAGGAGDVLGTAVRGKFAASLGKSAAARKLVRKAGDKVAYGAAEAEGAANGFSGMTRQTIKDELNSEGIKPFADMIRNSEKFAKADDATVVRETYKLMSKQQGGLSRRLKEQGYDAATQLAHDNIGLAKERLKTAGAEMMPSFPGAIEQHAESMGKKEAFEVSADASKRILKGSDIAGKKAEMNSPEAFEDYIKSLDPEQAQAATEGLLARTKKNAGLLPKGLVRSARIAPYLRQLDAKTGDRSGAAIRALVMAASDPTNR